MFGLFNKKKRELPPFDKLKDSPIKYFYFSRLAKWDWLSETMIHVFDNNAPRMITMDPWPQVVYLEADGQKSIYEFVYEMASQYGSREPIPEALDTMILELINDLLKDGLIELHAESKKLSPSVELPLSEQG